MIWLDDLKRDIRVALRTLARSASFTIAAVLTLALGVGLAAAMWIVFDAVLRRPLPVRDEDRIVVLWGEAEGSIRRLPLDYAHFRRFREEAQALEEVAGVLTPRAWPHAVRDGQRVLTLSLAAVTGNFFPVLGSEPTLGRLLRPEDDFKGVPPVTVISHRLWRAQFAGDPRVLGRTVTLHERDLTYTIVGVAPVGLEYPVAADFWVPLTPFMQLEVVPLGRLAPGATPRQAAADLRASFQRDATGAWRDARPAVSPLRDEIVGDVKPALRLLLAATTLLFVIACLNVANLLLARSSTRIHELTVRRALGAGQGRILRQLLAETSLLAGSSGVLGAAFGVLFVKGLLAVAPPELPRLEQIGVGAIPVAAIAATILGAVLLVGLLPLLLSSASARRLLPMSSRSTTHSKMSRRVQDGLVMLQVGLAMVVLTTAALFGRSLVHLQRLDLGFAPQNLIFLELSWPGTKSERPGAVTTSLYDSIAPRIAALPGIVSVSPMHLLPFEGASGGIDGPFIGEGTPFTDPTTAPTLSIEVVGPGYFDTLGIPLLQGRALAHGDRETSQRVIVVSDTVAKLFWPGGDALGRRLAMGQPRGAQDWWTIIGIVPDTRYRNMRARTPTVYVAPTQFITVNKLAVRTKVQPEAVITSIRDAVRESDAETIVTKVDTMDRLLATELAQPRLSSVLLAAFGCGALALSAVGMYAMLAYMVRRRTRELALRQALGASPSRLRRLVIGRALLLAGTGITVGLTASVALGRVLGSFLVGISAVDPPSLIGVALAVGAVTLVAAYVPAQRAMRTDPATTLHDE